jgi:hypothetical protein
VKSPHDREIFVEDRPVRGRHGIVVAPEKSMPIVGAVFRSVKQALPVPHRNFVRE